MASIFAAVDLSTVVAFVAATGVIIIGICMAFKGVDLGKRGVRKV
jgi:ABC-type sulfate transport system permease component